MSVTRYPVRSSPKWERHGRLVREDGEDANGRQHVLHPGAARDRQDVSHDPLGWLAAKGSDDAVDERVDIGGRNVNVRGVVLGPDSYTCTLRRRAGGVRCEG
jgi:hypothetical protein